ncbi:hypothetical protein D6777_01125 [Candidatus Woesearchaeota archaeon]|nr:MAG: hypothetical protein D6777_01125 [Candidatus Woesearchaeota archaeon]
MYKVAIVGAGNVGASLASRLLREDSVSKIKIYDTSDRFEAVYKDLADESVVVKAKPSLIKCKSIEDILDSEVVVTTIKANYDYRDYAPEDLRVVGIEKDFPRIKEFATFLARKKYEGKILNVSNPVDIVTKLISDYAENDKVYGFGMSMDVYRAKRFLAEAANVKPDSVDITIVGEHGDTMVPLYSSAKIYNQPIESFNLNLEEIKNKLRMHGASIVKVLGYTRFAPASAILEDVKFLLGMKDKSLMSVKFKDVYLGLPLYNKNGIIEPEIPRMTMKEFEDFEKSYEKLKKIYEKIKLSS